MPVTRRFKLRHALMGLLYLWVLKLNFDLLREARASSGVTLLPAILLAWVAVFIAGANIARWLDGANRYRSVRIALILTALLSSALGIWMLWHYTVFLFVGLVTLFQRPMELITLTLFGERLAAVLVALVTYFAFAWLSLRVAWEMLSGRPDAVVERVLGASGQPDLPRFTRMPPLQGATFRRAAQATKHQVTAPDSGPPGKQRYLRRPPELTPTFDGTYERHGPPVLLGMGYAHGADPRKREICEAIGWPAFEWVLRTQPSLQELVMALEALPHLAGAIDEDDAEEARSWISRLGDHPGQYVYTPPYRDAMDRAPDVTVRIAEVALRCLIDWDRERAAAGGLTPPRCESPPARADRSAGSTCGR